MKKLLALISILFAVQAKAVQINSYSLMPDGATIITPNVFHLVGQTNYWLNQLSSLGIEVDFWHNSERTWQSGHGSSYGSFNENFDNTVAPYGETVSDSAIRFTFDDPIHSIGATFFASQFPNVDNPIDSFDNNYQNVSYAVSVSSFIGSDTSLDLLNPFELALSSSYGNIQGPVEYLSTFRGTEVMASFAGISSSNPIRQVTFSGMRTNGDYLGVFGLLSFSTSEAPNVPPIQVPAPTPLALLGLGLAALGLTRRKSA